MTEYEKFWDELSGAYPISKGKFKISIAKNVFDLNSLLDSNFLDDLKKYLQDLIDSLNEDLLKQRLTEHGDHEVAKTKYTGLTGVVRFDCMLDKESKQLKIIELNSDYPDGFLLHDKTFSVLRKNNESLHRSFLSDLVKGEEYVFILFPEDADFLDAYHSEYEYLLETGLKVGIGTVKDLSLKDNFYWHGTNKISLIRRCCEVYKLPKSFFNNVETKIVNSLYKRALGYKDCLVGDHKFLLKTKDILQENLTDLIEQKDKWVLKPTNLSEGKGIILGINTSKNDWIDLLNQVNKEGNHIMQEYLNPGKIAIEYFSDGEIKKGEFYFDICPHFLIKDNQVVGTGHILMRFSEDKILNVAKGGAIGYGSIS